MTDLEKVITGLSRHGNSDCEYDKETMCPYWGESHCSSRLCLDALALLKAQEPRVMTVKDFENNPNVDHDGFLPAWIEYRRDGDWDEYWEGQPDEWGVCREDRIVYESMRYWTSRPTDEQREATPWE